MHIVVIAWAYVTLMMAISEESAVAGVMTFLLYGALPIVIIIYLSGTGERRRRRAAQAKERRDAAMTVPEVTPQDKHPGGGQGTSEP